MKNQRLFAKLHITGLTLLVTGLAGCAASTPTIDTSPEAELSFDGLHEVKGGQADKAWAMPGVDLTQYSKIMLQGAGIEYRPGGESPRSFSSRSRGGPYEVTEQQKEQFRAIVVNTFLEELAESEHFKLVEEAGPDVLLIRGALLDVVSWAPDDPVGRGVVLLSKVGEATLVLELRDSITEAVLVRAVDRRAAEGDGFAGGMSKSGRVENQAQVKRVVRYWAQLLRRRLDEFGAPKE